MAKTNLKKRKDGRYRKSIKTPEGIVYVYGYTIEELNDNYIQAQIKLKRGVKIKSQNILFGDYAVKWYYAYKSNKQEKTKDMYLNVLNNHIDYLADMKLGEITSDDVQQCLNECYDKPNQCHKVHMTLKQIFKAAIINKIITFNPCDGVELPKIQKSKKSRDLYDEEREALFHAKLSLKVKTFLYLGAFCGLRKGEILGLCVDDINFDTNTIHIEKVREASKKVKARIKPMPKTDAGIRDVIMIDIVRDQLIEYLKNLNTYYLFTMKDGNLMSESSYKKFWAKCKRELNSYFDEETITTLTSHMLRHEFSTNLFYSGVNELETQKLMGHADISTTRKIYTHLRQKSMEADTKLNNYINEKINNEKQLDKLN